MNKILLKLIAAGTMLAVLFVMVVTVSYAWFSFSDAPEVQGIQIAIAGSGTILIAPNQSETVNGVTYNYPGKFSQALHFNQHRQYDYLNAISGLNPVSTADGLHWYIPSYYGVNDAEVINGFATAGAIKPISQFYLDTRLEHANVTDPDASKQGNYVCLDFWVVSPVQDFNLRIGQGDDVEGSFVIEMMRVGTDADGDYTLTESLGSIAASSRIGFLVNRDIVVDDSMLYYANTDGYSSAYTMLRGNYNSSGDLPFQSENYDFTIYEPNGDLHPYGNDGEYLETKPLGFSEGGVIEADIRDRLSVQLTNTWSKGVSGKYNIQEAFEAISRAKKYSSSQVAEEDFYQSYLKGEVMSYVDKATFISNTSVLYNSMQEGRVSRGTMDVIAKSGATDDVCIAHLETGVPQRIRMFVWLEGQDADCVRNAGDVPFALGIELAGSTLDEKSKQNDQ